MHNKEMHEITPWQLEQAFRDLKLPYLVIGRTLPPSMRITLTPADYHSTARFLTEFAEACSNLRPDLNLLYNFELTTPDEKNSLRAVFSARSATAQHSDVDWLIEKIAHASQLVRLGISSEDKPTALDELIEVIRANRLRGGPTATVQADTVTHLKWPEDDAPPFYPPPAD